MTDYTAIISIGADEASVVTGDRVLLSQAFIESVAYSISVAREVHSAFGEFTAEEGTDPDTWTSSEVLFAGRGLGAWEGVKEQAHTWIVQFRGVTDAAHRQAIVGTLRDCLHVDARRFDQDAIALTYVQSDETILVG